MTKLYPACSLQRLSSADWQNECRLHQKLIDSFTGPHRVRRSSHLSHAVYDFLFTYYSASSKEIEVWHPGFGVLLEDGTDELSCSLQARRHYITHDGSIQLDPSWISSQVVRRLSYILSVNEAILERTERFGCFGLHEWAMVYQSPNSRHDLPLRLSCTEIDLLVESSTISCSHYDAFRFFTPAAEPLNRIGLSSLDRHSHDQGGCIHAVMDLYKWCYKLSPLISSTLLRHCFFLAVAAREIDMRASPYDLSDLGFAPIKIESEEGRQEYVTHQKILASKAYPLRKELIGTIKRVLFLFEEKACFVA